jgi:hypothetical protein
MAGTDQPHLRHHRQANSVRDPSCLSTPWRLAHPHVALPCSVALRHRPPAVRRTHHLSGDPRVRMGPQDGRRLRADVTPACPHTHRDVAAVPQPPGEASHPAGCAAVGSRQAEHARTLRRRARPRRPPGCDGLVRDGVPGPSAGAPQAPAARRLGGSALLAPLHRVWGALGRVARNDAPRGPDRRDHTVPHRPPQRLRRWRRRRAWRSQQTQSHGPALPVPVGHHQGCCAL